MADDRFAGAIDALKETIDDLLRQVAEKKMMANSLAQMGGMDPIYTDIEQPAEATSAGAIRSDQYSNFPGPSAAARAYLESRRKSGATTIDNIFDALERGGFAFQPGDQKNNLRIALGKDREVRRLPNGTYGLWVWYPNVKRDRDPKKVSDNADDAPASVPATDHPAETNND
jgi:hypothetical protein